MRPRHSPDSSSAVLITFCFQVNGIEDPLLVSIIPCPSYSMLQAKWRCFNAQLFARGSCEQDDSDSNDPFAIQRSSWQNNSPKPTISWDKMIRDIRTMIQFNNFRENLNRAIQHKNIKKYKYLLIYILLENIRPYDTYA